VTVTIHRRDIIPLTVKKAELGRARKQVAALCWRMAEGAPEVLLVTSRETGRWVLPKGWVPKDLSPYEAAKREAWEEAGAEGKIARDSIGRYAYRKLFASEKEVPCLVSVFSMRVDGLARDFPERDERGRRWFSPEAAASAVDEPDLADLLAAFDPGR
jgi:8-oxo-dGTP pyrophosphatase MutT (NUDIX family)